MPLCHALPVAKVRLASVNALLPSLHVPVHHDTHRRYRSLDGAGTLILYQN